MWQRGWWRWMSPVLTLTCNWSPSACVCSSELYRRYYQSDSAVHRHFLFSEEWGRSPFVASRKLEMWVQSFFPCAPQEWQYSWLRQTLDTQRLWYVYWMQGLGLCDTALVCIEPIWSKYSASIANIDTFYLWKQPIGLLVGESKSLQTALGFLSAKISDCISCQQSMYLPDCCSLHCWFKWRHDSRAEQGRRKSKMWK